MGLEVLEYKFCDSRSTILKLNRRDNKMRFAVFFACVHDGDDGIFVDYPYLAGIVNDRPTAEYLSKDITNDKSIPGAIITKIFPMGEEKLGDINKIICKHFNRLANDMYDIEESKARK